MGNAWVWVEFWFVEIAESRSFSTKKKTDNLEFKYNYIGHLIVKLKYLSAELYDEQWSRQITIFVSFSPAFIWVTFSLHIETNLFELGMQQRSQRKRVETDKQ